MPEILEAREAQIRDWNKLRWLLLIGNLLPIAMHGFLSKTNLMTWCFDIAQAAVGIFIWYYLTKRRKEYINKLARFKLTGTWYEP